MNLSALVAALGVLAIPATGVLLFVLWFLGGVS